MQIDFDDLRFTASDGVTQLNYWIESKTNSSTAKVWVDCSLIKGNNNIYMYYGNLNALPFSDGEKTNVFFDHFDAGASYDSSKWTMINLGNASVSSYPSLLGMHTGSGYAGAGLIANNPIPLGDYVVESYIKRNGGNIGGALGLAVGLTQKITRDLSYYGSYVNWAGFSIWSYTPYYNHSCFNNKVSYPYSNYSFGYWHRVKSKIINSTGTTISTTSFNGINQTINSGSGGTHLTEMYPFVHYGDLGYSDAFIDFIFIHKYENIEPIATFNSEETNQ
jgi:hypothetical protein